MQNLRASEHQKGIYYAVAAFLMWGLVPVYFKAVDDVPAFEVLAHRVVWSVVFLGLFLLLKGKLSELAALRNNPKILLSLGLSALVISINWLVFIWAVSEQRIVETTLGYFINPLINIVFGFFIFSERLRFLQLIAVAIAAVAVLYQIILIGELPWVALTLATSFSIYSVLRKKIPIDSITGLLVETLWLFPMALVYMIWLSSQNNFVLLNGSTEVQVLLLAAGLVTSLPLIAFAAGARRLSLTMVGLLQYIGPSIAFLIAVFYYNEPMDQDRLITFVMIWIALAIFSVEGVLVQQRKKQDLITPKTEESTQG
ncbi:EamA family transporter RarD [Neptuniibacter sp. QD72_48]|uniref:EamA family transporter RarD n=1 Tax=unclassified Neptuniibacter TaxID=2630693 RepID=UPI0039F4537B